MKGALAIDPRGLIEEAYRIEAITPAECRSIFLDWAIGFGSPGPADLRALLARYGSARPEHPMTTLLEEGLRGSPIAATRRGGARARRESG